MTRHPALVMFLLILAVAFSGGLALTSHVAAPRPAQVIPSGSATAGAAETDPGRTGAPLSAGDEPGPSPQRPSTGVEDTAVPHPTSMTVPVAYGVNPSMTEEPVGIGGQATWWFSFGHGLYAALRPDLGTKGDLAIVCGGKPYHCLSLPVITTCACLGPGSSRLIDLSRDAFESFAPASAGVVHIVLQVVKGGAP